MSSSSYSLGIVGTRTYTNWSSFCDHMNKVNLYFPFPPTAIISGGARGTDTLAERYAKTVLNIPIQIILPDWKTHGRAAGPIRNKEIVKRSDHVIAFWDGTSRGTKSTINLCKASNTPITIIRI